MLRHNATFLPALRPFDKLRAGKLRTNGSTVRADLLKAERSAA
jgi:hypothetical protein